MNTVLIDSLMGGAAYTLFIVYHAILVYNAQVHPRRTTIGQNKVTRMLWCKAVTGRTDLGILAVQTLRNGMMSSQILATTSFTITSGLAILILTTDWSTRKSFGIGDGTVSYLGNTTVMPPIKIFILLLCFIIAFFFYLQAIRAYYHASFLISIPSEQAGFIDAEYVGRILVRGANFHTLGTRAYYAAFLALLWMFGPIPMLVMSVLLVFVLSSQDYLPEEQPPLVEEDKAVDTEDTTVDAQAM